MSRRIRHFNQLLTPKIIWPARHNQNTKMELPLEGAIILTYAALLVCLWAWFIKPYRDSRPKKNRMKNDEEVLAFTCFKAEIYEELYVSDLAGHEQVENLFDLCGILQAQITDLGWQYLFHKYEFQGLLSIDKKSEWIWSEDVSQGEWQATILSHSLHAGYNPIHDCLGTWDDKTNVFHSMGMDYAIDWEEIYELDIENLKQDSQ